MSWLIGNNCSNPIGDFRSLLLSGKGNIIKIPGVYDALSALLAKKVGFQALYLSGGAFSASLGLPDLGVITLSEITNRTREIARAAGLPVLVDIDAGYGGIINVHRTVREMVEAGAAAIQIEDQDSPKKCGHLNGKKIISWQEMVQKITAARKASGDIVIVARTDAKDHEGLKGAIERAKAYVDAGADIVFPEALQSEKEFRSFAEATDFPLLANMTEFGKTPYYTAQQFQEWGYRFVIYPVTSLRIAAKAIERAYSLIQATGTQKDMLGDMQTRQELYDLISYYDYEELDSSIAKTVLPSEM